MHMQITNTHLCRIRIYTGKFTFFWPVKLEFSLDLFVLDGHHTLEIDDLVSKEDISIDY